MKSFLVLFSIFVFTLSFAQTHTSSGGGDGGPDAPHDSPVKTCKSYTDQVIPLEKHFTEEMGLTHQNENSFFESLDTLSLTLMYQSIKKLNDRKLACDYLIESKKKRLLRQILLIYQLSPEKSCDSFQVRKTKIDLIKYLLEKMS